MDRLRLGSCRITVGRGAARGLRVEGPAFLLVDRGALRHAGAFRDPRREWILPPGERSKSLAAYARAAGRLAAAGLERGRPIVGVGGGVVADLAGFLAATWKRGVPLHLVPTTLLAQVDAAIGGKNGIDLPAGKNLLGTIRQPDSVAIDPSLLATLPDREFRSGLAEVVKAGLVADAALFRLCEERMAALLRREPRAVDEAVLRAVRAKVRIVARDERESGLREVLNYGHTIGHALEAASGWRLRHGEAVAAGMEAAAFLGVELGLTPAALAGRQRAVLRAAGFELRLRLPRARVLAALAHDKKRRDGAARVVVVERPGRARRGVGVRERLLRAAVDRVLR